MSRPSAAWLRGGKRLHLQHGPIDLIIEADGAPREARLAYAQAMARFQTVLTELVDELPHLRTLCPKHGLGLKGPVARRMEAAVLPFFSRLMTPMAAVAGAVADEVLTAMMADRRLDRAYVNNGGDIALALGEDCRYDIAIVARPDHQRLLGKIGLRAGDGVGGIATSGRHGRSHSLGIADSVTVMAADAAFADAAATLIANAVDLPGHPGVTRAPARDLSPDSDLGERPVTLDVAPLSGPEIAEALDRGTAVATQLLTKSTVKAAALSLGSQVRIVGELPTWRPAKKPLGRMTKQHRNNMLEEKCFA